MRIESPCSEVNRPTPVPLSTETNHPAPATPAASPAPAEGSHAESLSRAAIASALGVAPEDVASFSLVKRSVDARKKSNVHFNATYAVRLVQGVAYDALFPARGVNVRAYDPPAPLAIPDLRSLATSSDERIVVAGTGPAGLFCALFLAEAGLRPLVVERGAAVDERTAAIESFNAGGPLDTAANVQFGEGGAGTFSDGKLTTGTKSPHIRHVLEAFVQAGAPDEILWQAKPHIGTDKLPAVVKSIRERIISAGGEVRFLTRLADIELSGGAVCSVVLEDSRTGAREVVEASRVIVACGHSARDIFELARNRGFALERKPFSMGVRIEHPQDAHQPCAIRRCCEARRSVPPTTRWRCASPLEQMLQERVASQGRMVSHVLLPSRARTAAVPKPLLMLAEFGRAMGPLFARMRPMARRPLRATMQPAACIPSACAQVGKSSRRQARRAVSSLTV